MRPILLRALSPKERLIVIGDIHGCFGELSDLLERIDPRPGDLVVSTGDIVRKGPDPVRCLELWRERGYLAVLGNNEEKILELARRRKRLRRPILGKEDRAVLRRRDLLSYIRRWPIAIDVARRGVTVVHGGFFPKMPITARSIARHAGDATSLRWIRREEGEWINVGKSRERDGDVLWPAAWKGPRTVVYGHTPLRKPRVDRYAIGLDTGCVYGGWLTAAIYDGEWSFRRVRARKQYAD
ncbi:MAG TPA: metallophosphoesterase family protein [Thermoanaerobaculia bacterium]|nr:metallophosphoesterase family protein [Thermoanaerobaculia bacterium]